MPVHSHTFSRRILACVIGCRCGSLGLKNAPRKNRAPTSALLLIAFDSPSARHFSHHSALPLCSTTSNRHHVQIPACKEYLARRSAAAINMSSSSTAFFRQSHHCRPFASPKPLPDVTGSNTEGSCAERAEYQCGHCCIVSYSAWSNCPGKQWLML